MGVEKIGLVVITLERYFKIVHADAYRKYYRGWTTGLGIVVPWITGFCSFVIPALLTTTAVPGQCPRMGSWSIDVHTVSKYDIVYDVMGALQGDTMHLTTKIGSHNP